MKANLPQVQSRRKAITLAVLCFSMYTVSYIGRLNFASALAEMVSTGILSKTQGGRIATAYFFCYGIGQLINGMLADRFKPQRLVTIGLLSSAVLNFLMSRLRSQLFMLLVWGVNGYCQALIWPPTFLIVSQSIPEIWRRKSLLLLNTASSAGTVAAFAFSSLVLRNHQWQNVFSYASVCLGLFVLLWIIGCRYSYIGAKIPAPQENITEKKQTAKQEQNNFLRTLIISGCLFLILPAFLHGMMKDGITTWLPTYITEVFSMPAQMAAAISILLPVINMLGATIAYWMMSFTKNETLSAVFLFGGAGLCFLPLLLWDNVNPFFTAFLFALVTAAMMAINVLFCTEVPVRFASMGKVATMSGFYNFCGYIGTAASMYAVAYISEVYGWNMTQIFWFGACIVAMVSCVAAMPRWKVFMQTQISEKK